MADATVVEATVGMTTVAPGTQRVTAGEPIDEGQPVYLKAADGKYWQAANTDAAMSDVKGVSLTPAIADEKFVMARTGDYECGFATVSGQMYCVSAVSKISPISDHTSADWLGVIGWGLPGTNVMHLNLVTTGIVMA